MRTLTFAEDNPQAATWFVLMHQGVSMATPGPRPTRTLALECQILQTLEGVSIPNGAPLPSGFTPRRLTEPCSVTFTDDALALAAAYVAAAGFPPYLSPAVLQLLTALRDAPETGSND